MQTCFLTQGQPYCVNVLLVKLPFLLPIATHPHCRTRKAPRTHRSFA